MSLAKIKQVITHLEEAKDVVFQIIQMNPSKTENTSYISRPISFEPADRMNDFLTEIQNKYLDRKKGFDNMFSACVSYDGNHVLSSDYSEVVVVGAGADAVDYKLISICHKGDIVVSQDYGVAAMALGKGAYAIHQSGKWYTNKNIDQMLMERHLNKKARRASGKNHIKGPRKRTAEDDEHFRASFEKMIHMAMDKEN